MYLPAWNSTDSLKIGKEEMSKVYRKWYTPDMSYYTDIYEEAIDNYGVITSAEAESIGVPKIELVKLARRGRIDRIGYGVYRVKPYVPTRLDRYADAVALVGEGSYVFGESVLAMHELAFANPRAIVVATPKRVRRALPGWIEVHGMRDGDTVSSYEGIPCQALVEALVWCKRSVLEDRLLDATEEARRQGWLTQAECERVIEVLKG